MENAGLLRRLGAILYDFFLLFALSALVTVPFVAVERDIVTPESLVHQLAILGVAYGFFIGFWTRTGSTLGMLAWGLRVEMKDGRAPTVGKASIRFFASIVSWLAFGLGFLWQLWDRDKLTWHDRLSDTRLRHYPKK